MASASQSLNGGCVMLRDYVTCVSILQHNAIQFGSPHWKLQSQEATSNKGHHYWEQGRY